MNKLVKDRLFEEEKENIHLFTEDEIDTIISEAIPIARDGVNAAAASIDQMSFQCGYGEKPSDALIKFAQCFWHSDSDDDEEYDDSEEKKLIETLFPEYWGGDEFTYEEIIEMEHNEEFWELYEKHARETEWHRQNRKREARPDIVLSAKNIAAKIYLSENNIIKEYIGRVYTTFE